MNCGKDLEKAKRFAVDSASRLGVIRTLVPFNDHWWLGWYPPCGPTAKGPFYLVKPDGTVTGPHEPEPACPSCG